MSHQRHKSNSRDVGMPREGYVLKRIDQLSSQVSALTKSVESVGAKVGALETKVDNFDKKVDTISNDVKANTALLNRYQGALALVAGVAIVVGLILGVLNYIDNHANALRAADQHQRLVIEQAPQKCPIQEKE